MPDQHTRVYDLDVTWPADHTGDRPRVQRTLSPETAHATAARLEALGAYVTVRPSHPVTWPLSPTEAADGLLLADQVAQLRYALDAARAIAAEAGQQVTESAQQVAQLRDALVSARADAAQAADALETERREADRWRTLYEGAKARAARLNQKV